MHWGMPIAPEAWSAEPAPWGDQYSNFNAGKILFFLEGMAGIEYSVPDQTLTVCDNMPEQWESMEVRIPVELNGSVRWPRITYQRFAEADAVEKTISVQQSPLSSVKIQPWLEGGRLLSASDGYSTRDQPRNHIGYRLNGSSASSVTIKIHKTD